MMGNLFCCSLLFSSLPTQGSHVGEGNVPGLKHNEKPDIHPQAIAQPYCLKSPVTGGSILLWGPHVPS